MDVSAVTRGSFQNFANAAIPADKSARMDSGFGEPDLPVTTGD
jgi:hypothetical protein